MARPPAFCSNLSWKPVLNLVSWTKRKKETTGAVSPGALRKMFKTVFWSRAVAPKETHTIPGLVAISSTA